MPAIKYLCYKKKEKNQTQLLLKRETTTLALIISYDFHYAHVHMLFFQRHNSHHM